MNNYTKAVDYLAEITQAYNEATALNEMELPNIESAIECAFKILRSHQDYDGQNPDFVKR